MIFEETMELYKRMESLKRFHKQLILKSDIKRARKVESLIKRIERKIVPGKVDIREHLINQLLEDNEQTSTDGNR